MAIVCKRDTTQARIDAITLRNAGYTYAEISENMGVSPATAFRLCNLIPQKLTIEDIQLSQNVKSYLQHKTLLASNQLLSSALTDDKIDKASTYQLVMASAVMLDKHRLLAGESTSNIALVTDSIKNIDEQQDELEKQINLLQQEIVLSTELSTDATDSMPTYSVCNNEHATGSGATASVAGNGDATGSTATASVD